MLIPPVQEVPLAPDADPKGRNISMKPPLLPQVLCAQIADVSQLISLLKSIPPVWQNVFAIILLTLFCLSLFLAICHQFLTLWSSSRDGHQQKISSRTLKKMGKRTAQKTHRRSNVV